MVEFNKKTIGRKLSFGIAFILASLVEYFFSKTHGFLVPMSTLLVMFSPVGNLIYHSALRFGVLVAVVVVFSLIFPPHDLLYYRVYDVTLGALIGITSNFFVFPRRADVEFRSALVPVFRSYKEYFLAILENVFDKSENAQAQRNAVEAQIQLLPTWVYESGFDLGLKESYQYFLMKTHRIGEILIAMHRYASFQFDAQLSSELQDLLNDCKDKGIQFFDALISILELKKLKEGVEDFGVELSTLENKFQSLLPVKPELVDLSDEDASFYGVIYGLVDLRKALLKLSQALR